MNFKSMIFALYNHVETAGPGWYWLDPYPTTSWRRRVKDILTLIKIYGNKFFWRGDLTRVQFLDDKPDPDSPKMAGSGSMVERIVRVCMTWKEPISFIKILGVQFRDMQITVLILDGNSEHGAHVRRNLGLLWFFSLIFFSPLSI